MKHFRFFFITFIFCLAMGLSLVPGSHALAGTKNQFQIFIPVVHGTGSQGQQGSSFPSLAEFAASIKNNNSGAIQGVYVENILALTVVQQPQSNSEYVSTLQNTVTQFDLARQLGVIGFLAHNNLGGKYFFRLEHGNLIYVIYGDGTIHKYVVNQIDQYQVLSPDNTTGSFKNISTGEVLSSSEIFFKYYTGSDQVTLQTCIAQGEAASWGRLFVVATPLP